MLSQSLNIIAQINVLFGVLSNPILSQVKGIQVHRVPMSYAVKGMNVGVSIRPTSKKMAHNLTFRRSMVLLDPALKPQCSKVQ